MISIDSNCLVWTTGDLVRSGHTSFVDANGHLCLIGGDVVYDLVSKIVYTDSPFRVQRFCDIEIKII